MKIFKPGDLFSLRYCRYSYSQNAEDIIIKNIFTGIGIEKPSYIDIGCHHPYKISNTARLYLKGSRGVNIDANKDLLKKFKIARPEDTNFNAGVSDTEGLATFHVHPDKSLSSFLHTNNHQNDISVYCYTIESIFKMFFVPDLLCIDVEGYDERILKLMISKPKVICVESNLMTGEKNHSLIEMLKEKGYYEYAFTGINSMMVLNTIKPK